MLSEYSLEGKSALITGGGRGIGRRSPWCWPRPAPTSRSLLEPWNKLNRLPMKYGPRPKLRRCAVRRIRFGQAEQAVSQATAALGKIDILVNNAGISYGAVPLIPIEKLPEGKDLR